MCTAKAMADTYEGDNYGGGDEMYANEDEFIDTSSGEGNFLINFKNKLVFLKK